MDGADNMKIIIETENEDVSLVKRRIERAINYSFSEAGQEFYWKLIESTNQQGQIIMEYMRERV